MRRPGLLDLLMPFLLAVSCRNVPIPREPSSSLPSVPDWSRPGPDSAYRAIDGATLHYRRLFPASFPARGRVLLIHGFGDSTEGWRFLAPALVREGYEVVAVDHPPFGWSTPSAAELSALSGAVGDPGLGSPLRRAALLGDFLDDLDAEGAGGDHPWIMVAHSLGGRIAAHLAATRPERVAGLVLIAPAVFGPVGSRSLAALGPFRALLAANLDRALEPRAMAAIMARAYGRPATAAEIEASRLPLTRPGGREAHLAWARVASEAREPALGALRAPTLILWGTRDRIVPNQGRRLARSIPGARYQAFPGGGHVLMETEAEEVEAAVLGFLRDLGGTPSP